LQRGNIRAAAKNGFDSQKGTKAQNKVQSSAFRLLRWEPGKLKLEL
jgi:hypothetical protein